MYLALVPTSQPVDSFIANYLTYYLAIYVIFTQHVILLLKYFLVCFSY